MFTRATPANAMAPPTMAAVVGASPSQAHATKQASTGVAYMELVTLDIADLDTQLAIANSAKEMEKRARDLGFRPVDKDELIYVVVPGYITRQRVEFAPAPEPVEVVAATLPADYTESLFEWIRKRMIYQLGRKPEVLP